MSHYLGEKAHQIEFPVQWVKSCNSLGLAYIFLLYVKIQQTTSVAVFSVLCVIRVLTALGTLLKWIKDLVYFLGGKEEFEPFA